MCTDKPLTIFLLPFLYKKKQKTEILAIQTSAVNVHNDTKHLKNQINNLFPSTPTHYFIENIIA